MFKIGIDGHNLEQPRAGVARTLLEELRGLIKIPFVRENFKFYLYFKARVPADPIFNDPIFEKKVLPHIFRPSSLVFYNILLPQQAKKDQIDLCYFPCYMLPLFYKGKSIVTIHDVAYEAHPNWFEPYHRYAYRILSGRASRQASAIVTISEFSKKEIMKYYRLPAEKVKVIPLAPSPHFRKIVDREKIKAVKEQCGLKNDYLLFVAQIFNRRHAYETMLAFEKIADNFAGLQFLVIGRDLTWPSLGIDNLAKEINQRLGREGIVRGSYIKLDDDLVALYNGAKLFIYASEYEGFGLPPAEALACGTPVLLADTEVAREIFGESGFYVSNPKDIDEIAKQISVALTDQKLREEKIAIAASQLKKYDWGNHCQSLSALFRKLLNC